MTAARLPSPDDARAALDAAGIQHREVRAT